MEMAKRMLDRLVESVRYRCCGLPPPLTDLALIKKKAEPGATCWSMVQTLHDVCHVRVA